MGIKSLKKILMKKCSKGIYLQTNISQFANKTIFIDTSIFMYRYKYLGDFYGKFLQMIYTLLKYNITPVFVFDGKPTDNKINNVLQYRKTQKEKVKEKITILETNLEKKKTNQNNSPNLVNFKQIQDIQQDEIQISKLKKQTIQITSQDYKSLKALFSSIGIKYLQAPYETDIIIPYLVRKFNFEPLCLSGDTDFLPHKINLLANFDIYTGTLDYFNYQEIKVEMGLSDAEFVDMCILMGCDYCENLKGIGPITSFNLIKTHKNLETYFKQINKQNINEYITARNMFINPGVIYEFDNNLTLGDFLIEDFKGLCEKLEIYVKMKDKIIKIRGALKFNPISNYFTKKIINN